MHGPSFAEHGGELRQILERRVRARVLVRGDEALLSLPILDCDRGDLAIEAPFRDRGGGPVLALERESVLLLATDLVEVSKLLRGFPHEHPAYRVQEPVAVHPVHQRCVPEPVPRPRAVEQIGNATHALRPPD